VFSVLACTLFVSVDDKLVSILPYHRKANAFRRFYTSFANAIHPMFHCFRDAEAAGSNPVATTGLMP
jgi:hypothetical protein